jgi:hypothetical protein
MIRIYELDNTLAMQVLESVQHFFRELIDVVGHEVSLDFVWLGPGVVAKWASGPGCVGRFNVGLS